MKMVTVLLLALLATPVVAETMTVQIVGDVEYVASDIPFGPFEPVVEGDPVNLTFTVDSATTIDGEFTPSRGYAIEANSFTLTVGPAVVGLQDPFPEGMTPYFVLRNDAEAGDSFYLSRVADWAQPLWLDAPGVEGDPLLGFFEVAFAGNVVDSLDLMEAVDPQIYPAVGFFNFGVNDGYNEAFYFNFTSMRILAPVATEATTMSELKALFN